MKKKELKNLAEGRETLGRIVESNRWRFKKDGIRVDMSMNDAVALLDFYDYLCSIKD